MSVEPPEPGAGPHDQDAARPHDQDAAGPHDQDAARPHDQDAARPHDQDAAGPHDQDAAGPRDRDAAGRARNARPRDALGRPLQRGAAGDERIPDDLALPPAQALRLAQQLLDEGRPFHAHEVLEASWKASPAAERDLWQGLAQIAVGLTHARRGNAHGAVALLRRGAERVAPYADSAPHDIDAATVCQAAREMAARIEREGLDEAGADAMTVRLVAA